ncbi:MAG: TIM-barrel domain-containing protein [Ginsengibacter sp.]
MKYMKSYLCKSLVLFCLMNIWFCGITMAENRTTNDSVFVIKTANYSIKILRKGFRYSVLKPDGDILLNSDSKSGLVLLRSDVTDAHLLYQNDREAKFAVTNDIGVKATVTISMFDHYFKMDVHFNDDSVKGSIVARTRGLAPAYGLADHAAFRTPYTTEVSGYRSYYFGARSDNASSRLVSNFVIFPKQGVACINLEPHKKIIEIKDNALVQGTVYCREMPALYYFIGPVKQIYADYLHVRNEEGYKVYLPKYDWFGVGWEAFGALGWNTNYKTVTSDVDRYLHAGFPLKWMVVGSGFWPNEDPRYVATTSFGYWDKRRYPDPAKFIDHFHDEGLKFILGLRIAFIPNGPYTSEGIEKGYFYKKDGTARLFKVGFPRTECYILDDHNPEAVKWYIHLCDKWKSFGVDGYKEDLYGYEIAGFPDDKIDIISAKLMDAGVYLMGRNGYVGSPMDISRFNDFNYNQDQDRGPVNGLAYGYSGFPYVYPDIIGGTGLTGKQFGSLENTKLGKYLMREAQYAAVNPSMSFGYGPWNLDNKEVLKVCLEAARLHARLHPYIYSAAVRTFLTGFPYTLTPLPLAYPADSATYYRENDQTRGYQWMIGDALMAIPLYGNDYNESETRNIYLPPGKWIDYDNGTVYQGPSLINNFKMPVDKTPLLVGGTGFVVETIDGQLKGRIYPVGYNSETVFYDKDEKMKSLIYIHGPFNKVSTITDESTTEKVRFQYKRFAYEFELIPGHNYSVK